MSSYRSNVCNRLCYVFAVGRSFDNPCPMLVAGTVGDQNPVNQQTKPIFSPQTICSEALASYFMLIELPLEKNIVWTKTEYRQI